MEVSHFYSGRDIYGGVDPREIPLYSVNEAARFIHLSSSTLTDWVQMPWKAPGSQRFNPPIIQMPEDNEGRLSFNNLVEAFVLKMLRRSKGLSMQRVRSAVWHARKERGIERPFLSKRLAVSGDLFWDDEGSILVNLSRGGQLALKAIVSQYLERLEWDEEDDLPARFYPYIAELKVEPTIVIDPRICFGQPTIRNHGIITSAILNRINAGEDEGEVAFDYGIPLELVTDALIYEASKN